MLSNVNNSFLAIYLEANKKLIQTSVIKSGIAAQATNDSIVSKYGNSSVDLDDPYTWKYYLNLTGKSHFSDIPVEVISLDSQELIEFTTENLAVHTATRKAYQLGSRYFYSLIKKYPTQESLIRGVLYPADITEAIAAVDGAILAYQPDLVEPQEMTLIDDLQNYFTMFLSRYNTPGYQDTNSYFTLVKYGVMAVHGLGHLLNLRQQRCHTIEAHSFHIRCYLASHGGLDKYIPYLTLEQQLYLYRNIRYIDHHSGSAKQFTELVDKILTKRNIPLAQFSVRQVSEFDENNYPRILVKRTPVTQGGNNTASEYTTLDKLYSKELLKTPGNEDYLRLHQAASAHKFKVTSSTVTQTKVLESSIVDYSDSVPDPLPAVLLHQWVYMSVHNLYKAQVYFTDSNTGEQRNMSSKDALSYMLYLQARKAGLTLDEVPGCVNVKFRRHPKPSLAELLRGVPNNQLIARKLIEQAWGRHPLLGVCISIDQFNKSALEVYNQCLWEWFMLSNIHDFRIYGYVKMALNKLYGVEEIPGSGEKVQEFLFRVRVPEYAYTDVQADTLIKTVFEAATGFSIDQTGQIRFVQKKLIELLSHLSSYSIQILADSNETPVVAMNWPMVRMTTPLISSKFQSYMYPEVRMVEPSVGMRETLLGSIPLKVKFESVKIFAPPTSKMKCVVDLMGQLSFNRSAVYIDSAPVRMSVSGLT